MAKVNHDKNLKNREFTDLSEETRAEITPFNEEGVEEVKIPKKTFTYTYMVGMEYPETYTIDIDSEALLDSVKVIDKIIVEKSYYKKMRHQIRIIHHCQVNKSEVKNGREI